MYLRPNAATTAGMGLHDLRDEQAEQAKSDLNAAIAATGATGTAARILFHDFYQRVHRSNDGQVAAIINGKPTPLVDALAAYFGVNPEMEGADKALAAYDTARSAQLRAYADMAQQNAKNIVRAARSAAWSNLPPQSRALHRISPTATHAELAAVMADEVARVSEPPESWTPST
jgi:hypothetical protein